VKRRRRKGKVLDPEAVKPLADTWDDFCKLSRNQVRLDLEAYLVDLGVPRKQVDEPWPTFAELGRVSQDERSRWERLRQQDTVDRILRALLDGKSVGVDPPRRRGRKKALSTALQFAIAIAHREGYSNADILLKLESYKETAHLEDVTRSIARWVGPEERKK
jgi:hypothetical protein